MTSTSLKPDIQGLQKDVVDLLEQVSQLMGRASIQLWSKDGFEAKYATYRDQVAEEARKVKNLELRMAIAAPMKAGKSTIINSIVGYELLPSRNAAMTTLPTELVLKQNLDQPVLTLSPELLSVFQKAWDILKQRIQELGDARVSIQIGEYPHLQKLLQVVRDSIAFPIRAKTYGRSKIIKTLEDLNDIIRLCSQLAPLADPLQALTDVPRIETPFSHFQGEVPTEALGNLVIVDTPGPNEAGENLRLVGVVEEQLQKSSLVLIVLDYTMLKTLAAEAIRIDVEKVIKIRGKESLYVLVNKVDQRTDKDMTPEQVQQFVTAEFDLDPSSIEERVFEISARRAFVASSFKQELIESPSVLLNQMRMARPLAQEVFGIDWEEELEAADVELLERKAERVWKKSGFSPFLNQAISALMMEVAPRCMEVALSIAKAHLVELQNGVKLRRSAIAEDAEKLSSEVAKLQQDLIALEECRQRLREKVELKKTELSQRLRATLKTLKAKSEQALQDYFLDELSQRLSIIEQKDVEMRKALLKAVRIPILTDIIEFIFPGSISRLFTYKITLIGRNEIKFHLKHEAEEFAGHIFVEARQIIERLLAHYFDEVQNQIKIFQIELKALLRKETREIIERAYDRLNREFNIELSLPDLILEETTDIDSTMPDIRISQEKRGFFEPIAMVFRFLFSGSRSHENQAYVVSLESIVKQINDSIEEKIKETEQEINIYLDADFQQTIEVFFSSLDGYLIDYQDNLNQALNDQNSSIENQDLLKQYLDTFAEDSSKHLEELKKKLSYVNKWITSTKLIAPSK